MRLILYQGIFLCVEIFSQPLKTAVHQYHCLGVVDQWQYLK
jgi:hypothetical protein